MFNSIFCLFIFFLYLTVSLHFRTTEVVAVLRELGWVKETALLYRIEKKISQNDWNMQRFEHSPEQDIC